MGVEAWFYNKIIYCTCSMGHRMLVRNRVYFLVASLKCDGLIFIIAK